MNDINKPSAPDNLGGLDKFWFIPTDHINNISDVSNGHATVTLLTGKSWFEFYTSKGSLQYSESMKEDEKGTYFDTKLSGFTPKDSEDLQQELQLMRSERFVCVYLDNNDNHKLIGSAEEPLHFVFSFKSGEASASRNGYDISFSRKLRSKAIFISNFS